MTHYSTHSTKKAHTCALDSHRTTTTRSRNTVVRDGDAYQSLWHVMEITLLRASIVCDRCCCQQRYVFVYVQVCNSIKPRAQHSAQHIAVRMTLMGPAKKTGSSPKLQCTDSTANTTEAIPYDQVLIEELLGGDALHD